MNRNILIAASFAAGTAIGSVVTWRLLKTKYEKIAQEEIDSVKEVFYRRICFYEEKIGKTEDEKTVNIPCPVDSEITLNRDVLDEIVDDNGYAPEEKVTMGYEHPYVVSPNEFGEIEEYDKISLTYFADKILVDENYEMVEDVENLVGFESLGHFGEYEDDSVFVRNDRLQADFEILLDVRNYSDVRKTLPRTSMEA